MIFDVINQQCWCQELFLAARLCSYWITKPFFFLLLPNLKWFCCFVKKYFNHSKLKPSEGTVICRSDSCSFYITMFLSGLGCLSLSPCASLYLDNTFKSQMTYKVCLMLAAPFLSCSVACLWCASQSSHSHCRCHSEDWKNATLDGDCGQPSSSSQRRLAHPWSHSLCMNMTGRERKSSPFKLGII